MDDASPPGQKKTEVPQEEAKLLPHEEVQEVKVVLDWALECLEPDTPVKVSGDNEVAQAKQQQQVQVGVVKPKEEKTLGERFEEMRKTREEREMEKLRRKAQKAKEKKGFERKAKE